MLERHVLIAGIPAVFWGPDSGRCILAVHDAGGNKQCPSIRTLAELAVPLGWQVVSFDLPGHGARRREWGACLPRRCAEELRQLRDLLAPGHRLRLFAEGLGAQWAVLAFQNTALERALLLSPAVGPGLPLTRWDTPTAILSASECAGCAFGTAGDFARRWNCSFMHADSTGTARRQFIERWLKCPAPYDRLDA